MLLWTSCTVTTNFVNGKIWSLLTAQNLRPHLWLGRQTNAALLEQEQPHPPLLRDAKL